jgi:hypothetical protein
VLAVINLGYISKSFKKRRRASKDYSSGLTIFENLFVIS